MVTDGLACDHFFAGNSMGLASIAIVIPSDLCYDKIKLIHPNRSFHHLPHCSPMIDA